MLQYFIVIALALQVGVFAEILDCIYGTFDERLLYNNYEDMFDNYVQKKDSDSFTKLNNAFKAFATEINGSCAYGTLEMIQNPPFFIKLIEYAVKDGKYSKFIESGGNVCVSTVKEHLTTCVSNIMGTTNGGDKNANDTQNPTDLGATIVQYHHVLFKHSLKMAYLQFNEMNCDLTDDIRVCVKTVMKDDQYNATCKPEHSEFVDSLFNFTMTMCPSSTEEEKSPETLQTGGANSLFYMPVVMSLSPNSDVEINLSIKHSTKS